MEIAYFLSLTGSFDAMAEVRTWFEGTPLTALKARPGVLTIDLFSPEKASDPHINDGEGPLLLVELGFDSIAGLETAVGHEAVLTALGGPPNMPMGGLGMTHEAFEAVHFPVAGNDRPAPRTAPLSYVVRYYRPAEDEQAFTAFYVAHHPPVLAQLPGIRNVICYLPVVWRDPTAIAASDCMLGNEVVFDSTDALNAALNSPVRDKLREDYLRFPPFSGPATHYAMKRTGIR